MQDRAPSLGHVGISVSDLERSIQFYTQFFGMQLAGPIYPFRGEPFVEIMALDQARGRIATLVHPSIQLELFEFASPRPASQDLAYSVADIGLTHFGIQVDDIDAIYEQLRTAGVRFHGPVREFTGGIRAAYGRDPDGNVFELLALGGGGGD